jgi:endonuclease/exonuclease/phosphatase family metal-dependent hydrolase
MHRSAVSAASALLLLSACAILPDHGDGGRAASCRSTQAGAAGGTATPTRWLLSRADAPALDAWCAAVGPAVAIAATVTPDEAVDSLLVVSWNVHVGGGDMVRFVADLRSGALTGGPVRHFALLLQETHRTGPVVPQPLDGARIAERISRQPLHGQRLPVDELARHLGLHGIYVPSMQNGRVRGAAVREDRGNAILATLPLETPVALELPLVRQRRVAVTGVARGRTGAGAAWTLQLTSVHLENRGGRDVLGVSGRARQAEWLVGALPSAGLAVLGGDLNTWVLGAAEPAVTAMLPHFPDTPDALPDGPTHTSHVVVRARLDYLFARMPGGAMTAYARAPGQYGSDHYPVMAWLHFPGAAGLSSP